MRIAYLINQYPTISHSFIRREILALERQGHEVLRISVRGWGDAQQGKEDQLEQTRTRWSLVIRAGFRCRDPLLNTRRSSHGALEISKK